MKATLLFSLFVLFLIPVTFALESDVVHHPAPKKPVYLDESLYETVQKQLTPPPAKNSPEQKKDEETLLRFQKDRKKEDCDRAKSEVLVSLENFFGTPYGPLTKEEVKILSPFFDQVRNDGDFFIQKLKKDFPRDRPFLYVKNLTPCVAKEVTKSYPSGHAMLSELFKLVLNEFYPQYLARLETRARQIAEDRVLAGMHHPTDIEAGRALAKVVFKELKKSEKYQDDFRKVLAQLKKRT